MRIPGADTSKWMWAGRWGCREVARSSVPTGPSAGIGYAMSGSLARLRKLFDDPLLVRNGRTLVPTARAEALAGPVRDILRQVAGVIASSEQFVAATATRTFSVSASDYATAVLIAPMIRTLSAEAPHVTINVRPRSEDVHTLLREDRADLAIEPAEIMRGTTLPSSPLFRDRWRCALDATVNAVAVRDGLDLEQFRRLPHIVYSIGQDMRLNLADQHLAELGIQRRIELTIESFLLVPVLVRGTSMVSLVLERSARLAQVDGVVLVDPPIPVPDINEAMYWNPRHTDDPGHRWLRRRVADAAAAMTSSPEPPAVG